MTPTTHRDDWPCDGPCEICYPLSGQPDMEADALDKLALVDSAVRHGEQINRLAAIIHKVDGNRDLSAAALAVAILHEWTPPEPGFALSWGDRNLIVSGLGMLLAEPVDPIVNPQEQMDEIRALRDRIGKGTGV